MVTDGKFEAPFCCYLQAFMMCVVEILKLGMPTIPPAFQLTSSKLWKTWRHSKFQSWGIYENLFMFIFPTMYSCCVPVRSVDDGQFQPPFAASQLLS